MPYAPSGCNRKKTNQPTMPIMGQCYQLAGYRIINDVVSVAAIYQLLGPYVKVFLNFEAEENQVEASS
jgi:hypothetical protein